MVKHRDRHGRGLRGRVAWPNPYTGAPVPLKMKQSPERFFALCVADALAQIQDACPRALAAVDMGIEEVPTLDSAAWAPNRVPLASAITPTLASNGQIVVYRRPIERRAATRKGLRILVFRTIVEQLSSVTGIAVDEIDPAGRRDTGEGEWGD